MENKNVAKLLENCPKGNIKEEFLYDGRYGINGECMLFPSKDKTSWEGFHRPFVDGDVAITNRGEIHLLRTADSSYCAYRARWKGLPKFDNKITTDIEVLRLATEEEKKRLLQAIKDNGYKWNAEKKCLEKLEKERFDISTFKPYDKVLARFGNNIKWFPAEFGLYNEEDKLFVLAGGYAARQCIPFEGNEHLRGKRDDCDEFYKTWEE